MSNKSQKGNRGCYSFMRSLRLHLNKFSLGRKLFAFFFFLMWPENSIRNDIFCPYSTQTKTVRLNWRRGPGTQNAAHLARAKGIFPSGNRTAQVLTLPPPLSHRHHHKSHTCCSHVLDETNALSRHFIHKDFISFRFHPDSKRPQGVGLDQQK